MAFLGSPQENLLHRTLGVTLASQLICLEPPPREDFDSPPLVREKMVPSEYMLHLSLPSDGSETSLHQTLAKFVEGEVLSDFKWEQPDGTQALRRSLKRECIGALSDTLMLHLNRFRMNWETFTTVKTNSRFTFPHELDLFPYSQQGLSQGEAGTAGGGKAATVRPVSYYQQVCAMALPSPRNVFGGGG